MMKHSIWRSWLSLVLICSGGVAVAFQSPSGYIAPKSGWLYVAGMDGDIGRVAFVDPIAGRILPLLTRGGSPEVLVSDDSTRIFVASRAGGPQPWMFETFLSATGELVGRTRDRYSRGMKGLTYQNHMVLSRDGESLFVHRRAVTNEDGAIDMLMTLDVNTNKWRPQAVKLPVCGEFAGLLPSQSRGDTVYVVCPESRDVRIVRVDATGAAAAPVKRTQLAIKGRQHVFLTSFFAADGDSLVVVASNGEFAQIAVPSGVILREDTLDRLARGAALPDFRPTIHHGEYAPASSDSRDWLSGRVVLDIEPGISKDDTGHVYLQIASPLELVKIETRGMTKVSSFPLTSRFPTISVTSDLTKLYACSAETSSLIVIEAATGRILRQIGPFNFKPSVSGVFR